MFGALVFLVSIAAGLVASVAGFGIGSLLTPLLATHYPLKLAVAAVSIPHLVATAVRFWMLRAHVDRKLLLGFGITSALGGLAGAFLFRITTSPALTIVFGCALLLASALELTGASGRMKLHGAIAWIAGAASGFLGGLVGNQGGIRTAALMGFETTPLSFVATATAIALLVDLARLPIYAAVNGPELRSILPVLAIGVVGALIGTFAGRVILTRLRPAVFKRWVSVLILALSVYMLVKGISAL